MELAELIKKLLSIKEKFVDFRYNGSVKMFEFSISNKNNNLQKINVSFYLDLEVDNRNRFYEHLELRSLWTENIEKANEVLDFILKDFNKAYNSDDLFELLKGE